MRSIFYCLAALLGVQTLGTATFGIQNEAAAQIIPSSPHDENRPVGWAGVDGLTTGAGNSQDCVVVTTMMEFEKVMRGTEPRVIYLQGTIETVAGMRVFKAVENKTVIGLPGSSFYNKYAGEIKQLSGIMSLRECKNIIIRNVTFRSAGAYDMDGRDNLDLRGCDHIWVDHCDFQDGMDSNVNCGKGSDHISFTWCRFRYLEAPRAGGPGGTRDHRYSNLWGGGDDIAIDENRLNTTFAFCWWDEGCRERMPRARFGQIHIYNCLFSSSAAVYCVGGGYKSNIVIEACDFTGQSTPWKLYAKAKGKTDFNVDLREGNLGAKAMKASSGNAPFFNPAQRYEYKAIPAADVREVLTNPQSGAGATLDTMPAAD